MRNVVIIGAGSGIGFELAQIFLNDGHRVLVLTRSTEAYKNLSHKNLNTEKFDLEDDKLAARVAEKVRLHFDQVDVLVNNAGFLVNKPFETITEAELRKSYRINVMGIYFSIQGLLGLMNKGAHIVNISSMGGFQGTAKFPGLSSYSPAKAALCSLTEILAEELAPREIKVNCLALGAVQTEMLEKAFPGYQAPLTAKEMATYIADFALTGAQYFNGKILPVSVSTP